jgi:hypothetical protein
MYKVGIQDYVGTGEGAFVVVVVALLSAANDRSGR